MRKKEFSAIYYNFLAWVLLGGNLHNKFQLEDILNRPCAMTNMI